MLEVLQFIFSGFWVFIGTLVLISCMGFALARVILAFKGKDV